MILGTPLIAGVLNSFIPGKTISSSAVNDNFSNLQGQIDTLCQRPGQIAVVAQVDANGDLDGEPFTCNGGNVITERILAGYYRVSVEGLDNRDFFLRVTPLWSTQNDIACNITFDVDPPDVPQVSCNDINPPQGADTAFLVTWIRKP